MSLLRVAYLGFLLGLSCAAPALASQAAVDAAVPTFTRTFTAAGRSYSIQVVGRAPEQGGTTTIPTALVPLALSFQSAGKTIVMEPGASVAQVVHSPVFTPYAFATGTTQYGDALQRAEFWQPDGAKDWHTLLAQPTVAAPLRIAIPPDRGYLLTSRRTGKTLAIVDLDYVQGELFKRLPRVAAGSLVIGLAKNVAWYSLGDATVCCSMGTHGVSAGQAFLLSSFMDAGALPRVTDVQGLTQQIAEWMNDPLHGVATNMFPAWRMPPDNLGCGGRNEGSAYLFAEPTDGGELPNAAMVSVAGTTYHLENAALLPWFMQTAASGSYKHAYSFPDQHLLTAPAAACRDHAQPAPSIAAHPLANTRPANGHALIGYWEGYGSASETFPLRAVSPQWDVVIVTFASPVKGSTSLLRFNPPAGMTEAALKADVAYLQHRGRKVLISLGGGGAVVTLATDEDRRNFVQSVADIVTRYGFDGVDLDIETPSLLIEPGDTDFRRPKTPSIVNLIEAMHTLRRHFGAAFMVAEVPEAAQTQAGMQTYAGQFGSFLPVIFGTRDILSFVDAQDYNTPPLEGLDGNYYLPGDADYHVAMEELLLHGFPVAGGAGGFFPAVPASEVAIGLPATPTSARNYTAIPQVEAALRALVEGRSYLGARYALVRPGGYPAFKGAMFWAINEDQKNGYTMSNAIGPLLHGFPDVKARTP
jgi:chitinase